MTKSICQKVDPEHRNGTVIGKNYDSNV